MINVATILLVKTPLRVCITLGLALTLGCSGPRLRPAFESVNPQERTAALLEAARLEDEEAIPELIIMLYSGDPAERMLADEALRRLTGQDFGYLHYAQPWERELAADQWSDWWRSRGGSPMVLLTTRQSGDRKNEAP